MSISHSLLNAVSGLGAASRAAEVVSNNVANAGTEGYGRRELSLSSRSLGGVSVDGVRRLVDEALARDRWSADASSGGAGVRADFYASMERLVGTPDAADSISARTAAFEARLLEAASRPDSAARLQNVADAAAALAGQLNSASDGVQSLRMDAESRIRGEVDTLNTSLRRLADINKDVMVARGSGRDTSTLMDQRQKLMDGIASIVPVRIFDRDNGAIAIYTTQGARLLDAQPSEIAFARANQIGPETTLGSGALSGLTINGRSIATGGASSPIAGGSLAAHFDLRDNLAVEAQSQLDAAARDLVERFSGPGVDPTLATGEAGLFTDANGAGPVVELGLAGRIALSDRANPAQGGDLWRIRDGLNAAGPGDAGDARGLQAYADALSARRAPGSGGFSGAHSFSSLGGELVSIFGVARQGAEAEAAQATGRADSLRQMQLADGVDTDAEMQRLMLIEQAYAANARVISTVDEMLQLLMRI